MNNKKIILGTVWTVGLLAVGVGGYWYFSGGAGPSGSAAWSSGVALVESSWNEAAGLAPATNTDTVADAGATADGTEPVPVTVPAPATPPGPPPVYSTPAVSSTVAVATTTVAAPSSSSSSNMTTQPVRPPVIAYAAPSSSTVSPVPTSSIAIETTAATRTPESQATTTTTITDIASTSATSSPSDETAPTSTPTSTTAASASVNHPVIVQVQIAGAVSANDFVKIFNPTGAVVDLTGWKLHKKSSTGTDYSLKTFPTGATIASGAYLTWANSENGFADSIGADVSSSETLSADNSVALMDPSATVIDAVAWGTGTNQYVEGDAYPTSPTANQVLIRKSSNGTVVDTDDNANDFTVQ